MCSVQPRSAYSTASGLRTGGTSSSGRLHSPSVTHAFTGARFRVGRTCHQAQVSATTPATIRIRFNGIGAARPTALTQADGQPSRSKENSG